MRIPIALQLALLVLITSLVGLMVISIATVRMSQHPDNLQRLMAR